MIDFRDERNHAKVKLPTPVFEQMLSFSRDAVPNETGGILIGRYSSNRRQALITDASAAPEDSVATRTTFERGLRGLLELLRGRWPKDEYYLGEWHFHPHAAPDASNTDINQMVWLAGSTLRCPQPILLIVGGNPHAEPSLHAYLFGFSECPIVLQHSPPKGA